MKMTPDGYLRAAGLTLALLIASAATNGAQAPSSSNISGRWHVEGVMSAHGLLISPKAPA